MSNKWQPQSESKSIEIIADQIYQDTKENKKKCVRCFFARPVMQYFGWAESNNEQAIFPTMENYMTVTNILKTRPIEEQ